MAGFINKERCINLLQDLSRELGRTVLSIDVENRAVLYRSILHHFVSFDAVRRAAGLPGPKRERRWSQDAMMEELRRLYHEGVHITAWDLTRHGRSDLIAAARTYCGGVAHARSLAGIPLAPLAKDRERWDQERIVNEILSLHKAGESLAPAQIPRKLASAAHYHFGSYRNAVEAAGLDYSAVRLKREAYTREDIIREIRALAEMSPEMTISELYAHGISRGCFREFGSLEAAVLAAGVSQWPRRWSNPLLTKAATRKALQTRIRNGLPVSVSVLQREDLRLLRSAMRHFGGTIEGESGEDLFDEPRLRPLTKEGIINGLRARQSEGFPINKTALLKEEPRLYRAAVRQFGSLLKATTCAGVEINPLRKFCWTTEELREALHTRWRAGLPLNPQALNQEEHWLYSALRKRYRDFWRPEVAREFGLPPDVMAPIKPRWSPEKVIAEIQAFASGTDPVRWGQIRSILKNMAIKYFGSMDAARTAAGLPDGKKGSDEPKGS